VALAVGRERSGARPAVQSRAVRSVTITTWRFTSSAASWRASRSSAAPQTAGAWRAGSAATASFAASTALEPAVRGTSTAGERPVEASTRGSLLTTTAKASSVERLSSTSVTWAFTASDTERASRRAAVLALVSSSR
jgi:hypothetical protein